MKNPLKLNFARQKLLPTEDMEQRVVCDVLDRTKIWYCHVPNGGKRSKIEAAIMSGLGVKRGVPDILIFDSPPEFPTYKGLAIEMKRMKGSKTSEDQLIWKQELERRGWIAVICKGSVEAFEVMERMGYIKRGIYGPKH